MRNVLIPLSAVFTFSLLAMAPSQASAKSSDRTRAFSLTHSPTHLLIVTQEVTGELCIGRNHGVAGIVGLGAPMGVLVGELGASYRYYATGNFDRGMQLGGELLMGAGDNGATALQSSLMIGGKYTWDFGLTMEGQAGPSLLNGELAPMVNFNMGWSFGKKRW